jgi:hypothetical protein
VCSANPGTLALSRFAILRIVRVLMADIKIYAKPPSLFRYRPLGAKTAREIDALIKGYIYCPAFSDMNDPMEGLYRLSVRFESNPNSAKSQTRVKKALERMGIASMSEVYDHEPMWAHYADQFQGMCVQYNLSRLLRGFLTMSLSPE